MTQRFPFLALMLAALLLHASLAFAADCSVTIDMQSPVLNNGFGHDLANTRHPASAITSANVARLTLAVSHAWPDAKERRGAPVVTEQAIFSSTRYGVAAIDRKTGCRYWAYTPYDQNADPFRTGVRSLYLVNEGGDRPALLFAGDMAGVLHAIDAKTGKLVWKKFIGTDTDNHIITGTPVFYDGKLFVPISTFEVARTVFNNLPCCRSHGMVQAVEPYSGKIIWSFHVTDEAGVQADNASRLGPNGGSVWSSPAVDPERKTLFIGTGQNLTQPSTTTSDAVIALDTDTGRIKWSFQSTANDAWNISCQLPALWGRESKCDRPEGGDLDIGAAPLLTKLPNGRPVVIGGAKNGAVYVLDRVSGELLWSKRVGAGGNLGGIHWGMTTDGQHLFVGINDLSSPKLTVLDRPGAPAKIVAADDARPGVYALDLASGAIKWERHPTHEFKGRAVQSVFSAALTVTNDVVFAGSLDGVVHAFRSSDGTALWSYNTVNTTAMSDSAGNALQGGTIDGAGITVAGSDLIINSGYNTFGGASQFQGGPGNALLVLRMTDHDAGTAAPTSKGQ